MYYTLIPSLLCRGRERKPFIQCLDLVPGLGLRQPTKPKGSGLTESSNQPNPKAVGSQNLHVHNVPGFCLPNNQAQKAV